MFSRSAVAASLIHGDTICTAVERFSSGTVPWSPNLIVRSKVALTSIFRYSSSSSDPIKSKSGLMSFYVSPHEVLLLHGLDSPELGGAAQVPVEIFSIRLMISSVYFHSLVSTWRFFHLICDLQPKKSQLFSQIAIVKRPDEMFYMFTT